MSSSEVVGVTGATGFIGSWVVKTLLDAGYTVHGSVRDVDGAKAAELRRLCGTERLRLFAADLTAAGSFDACFAGCAAVIHVASPFDFPDGGSSAEQQFYAPAIGGTLSVLSACLAAGVQRVVVTGSLSSVIDDQPQPGHCYDETRWNAATQQPYIYSKCAAEQLAWRFAAEHGLRLTVLHPSFVLGPPLLARCDPSSLSVRYMRAILAGRPPLFPLASPCVSVVDVALAHVRALQRPATAGMRLIVSLENTYSTAQLVNTLRHLIYSHQTIDQTVDQTVDQIVDQTVDQTVDQIVDQKVDQTVDQIVDQTVDQIVDQTVNAEQDDVQIATQQTVDVQIGTSEDKEKDEVMTSSQWRVSNTAAVEQLGIDFAPFATFVVQMAEALLGSGSK